VKLNTDFRRAIYVIFGHRHKNVVAIAQQLCHFSNITTARITSTYEHFLDPVYKLDGATENAGLENAGLENAGLENAGPNRRGRKRVFSVPS